MRGSSAGLRGQGDSSKTRTSPLSALRSPSMISRVVVLPAPLGPRMPKNSPDSTSNERPSTACTSPYHLRTSLTLMVDAMADTVAITGKLRPAPLRYRSGAGRRRISVHHERVRGRVGVADGVERAVVVAVGEHLVHGAVLVRVVADEVEVLVEVTVGVHRVEGSVVVVVGDDLVEEAVLVGVPAVEVDATVVVAVGHLVVLPPVVVAVTHVGLEPAGVVLVVLRRVDQAVAVVVVADEVGVAVMVHVGQDVDAAVRVLVDPVLVPVPVAVNVGVVVLAHRSLPGPAPSTTTTLEAAGRGLLTETCHARMSR